MRNIDWRTKLYDYFDDVRRVPFNNDTNNCAQFIANGWLLMRSDDPFGKYRTLKSYEAILRAAKKDGYERYSDFLDGFLQRYEHPSQAKTGDIALFAVDDAVGELAGWVNGDLVFVLRPDGLATYPLANAIKAFEV
jgi:hypothetical protein